MNTCCRYFTIGFTLALVWTNPTLMGWAGNDFCPLDCATSPTGSANAQLLNAQLNEETSQDGVQVHVNQRFYQKPDRAVSPEQKDSPRLRPVLPTLSPERLDGQTAPTASSPGGAAGASAGAKSSSPGIQPRQPRGPRQGRQPRIKFSPRA